MIVTSQTLHDGERNLVMELSGIGDGTGDETDVRKVDVSELAPPCASVRIRKITYAVSYGLVKLSWDALTPQALPVVLEGQGEFDYEREGGLTNNAGGGKTGDLLLSTVGFQIDSAYTIKLDMVKKY